LVPVGRKMGRPIETLISVRRRSVSYLCGRAVDRKDGKGGRDLRSSSDPFWSLDGTSLPQSVREISIASTHVFRKSNLRYYGQFHAPGRQNERLGTHQKPGSRCMAGHGTAVSSFNGRAAAGSVGCPIFVCRAHRSETQLPDLRRFDFRCFSARGADDRDARRLAGRAARLRRGVLAAECPMTPRRGFFRSLLAGCEARPSRRRGSK